MANPRTRRTLIVITALVLLAALVIPVNDMASAKSKSKATPKPKATIAPANPGGPKYDPEHPEILLAEQLYATAAILMDQDTGAVLIEKDADARVFPASTTKIMTLLLALEYGHLNDTVTIPKEAADIPGDSSRVPVQIGEKFKFRDLLYAFMMRSGNDGANAVAVIIDGSLEKFIDRMNRKATELGMTGTSFANAHGHNDDNHYTTARDMAILAREAMQNEAFRKIVSTTQYKLPPSNKREKELVINTTNQFLLRDIRYAPNLYKYGTGIKTGYTTPAGQCFVGSATKQGVNLICSVMHSTERIKEAKWLDASRLMEYGFSKYVNFTFDQLYDKAPVTAEIKNAAEDDTGSGRLRLDINDSSAADYSVGVIEGEIEAALEEFRGQMSVAYSASLTAPIRAGDMMGTLTFTPRYGPSVNLALIASRDVEAMPAESGPTTAPPQAEVTDGATGPSEPAFSIPVSWLMIPAGGIGLIMFITLIRSIVLAGRRARRRKAIKRRGALRRSGRSM